MYPLKGEHCRIIYQEINVDPETSSGRDRPLALAYTIFHVVTSGTLLGLIWAELTAPTNIHK